MVRWIGRLAHLLARAAIWSVVLLIIAFVFLTQTPWGTGWVLRQVLAQVEGVVNGQLTVEGVSSPGLLRGFTLRGIRIVGVDGREFVRADSLRAGLAASALLQGDLVFTRVNLWNPTVTLEQLPGQDRINVAEIFAPRRQEPDSAAQEEPATESREEAMGQGRTVQLQGVRLYQASLDILLPLSEGDGTERILVEPGPDGRPTLRRMSFRDLELRLGEVTLVAPGEEGERFELQDLSVTGQIWREPFRVESAQGQLRREGDRFLGSLREILLPGSQASGRVEVQWGLDRGTRISVQGEAASLALADLHFLEARLPQGTARGPFGLEVDSRGVLLDFRNTEAVVGEARVRGNGGLLLGREVGLRSLSLALENLDLALLDPWIPEPLPVQGWVTGDVTLGGGPGALEVEGDVRFTDTDSLGSTRARLSGLLHLTGDPGVENVEVTLAPMEWGTLAGLSPHLALRGPGAIRLEATGSLRDGLGVTAEATHVPSDSEPSRVTLSGMIWADSSDVTLDLSGELRPLSLTTLARAYPRLPLQGEYAGTLQLRGPLSELEVTGELETSAGPLSVAARLDARQPARDYSLDAGVEAFTLSTLVRNLPEPTTLSGRIMASGSGFDPDSIRGTATVFITQGRIGELDVDTAAVVARVEGGILHLDALTAETELGAVNAGGAFGVASTAPDGEITLQVESRSLAALRPFLMEEVPVVVDQLTPFQRDLLVLEGVDLDTLPTSAEVALDGRLQGRATFRGGFRDFSGEGTLAIQELRYRTDYLESGSVTFQAQGLPGSQMRVQASLQLDSLKAGPLSFQGGEGEVDLGRRDGRVRVVAHRSGNEEYRARGSYALDSVAGGIIRLDELSMRFDTARWNLGGPTSLAWNPDGYRVRDFRLLRPGSGFMRIRADGFLPLRGEGDFQLEVERLNLNRLAQLLQMTEVPEGVVDFQARITGSSDQPRVEGSLSGEGLRFRQLALDGLSSVFTYGDLALAGEVTAQNGGREVFSLEGTFPADLRLQTDGSRFPEAPVDLTLVVDSFPAGLGLAFLEAMEEVEGTLSGEVRLAGTPRQLEPTGELRLTGGSALFPALGVRHNAVEARLSVTRDRIVEVEGSLRARGTARVSGTVNLEPLDDPGLNLTVVTEDFQAVNRRDVQARLSGEMNILKSYRKPRVEGRLTVEEGVLQVEEVARSAEVVDLSNPAFFDVVDTTLVTLRPVLQASQNPFLQNLQLFVNVQLARDSWLRGRDLNVEMGGDLQVFWDRQERDLALVGTLRAVRGVYSVLGRQFQVQEGTVSFQGIPGINPDLSIRALNRLRTVNNERLDIIASVEGSLLNPRVSLSSNAPFPIAQSDLVSYLIFGRPSYDLASGQSSLVEGAAGSVLGAASGATANLALGIVGRDLGSVFTRDVGLDYLAISQGQDAATLGTRDLLGTVATTQVEIGQYLTEDIFAALLWRPLTGLGGSSQSQFAGLRMEWRVTDFWTLEGFIEDRFARSPLFRAGDLGYRLDKVLGFFFYKEWGY